MNLSSLTKPMKNYLNFQVSKFKNNDCPKENDVDVQFISHGIDVIISNNYTSTIDVMDNFEMESEYYKVSNLPLHCLVNKQFIEAFIKKGEFYLMSVDTKIDMDNCVAMLPPGYLVLNFDKSTYEELGLQGQPSKFNRKHPNKFVITFDVTEDSFTSGKRNYDRVVDRLTSLSHLFFDCILAWKPFDSCICQSSIAAYFKNHLNLNVTPCHVLRKTLLNSKFPEPIINPECFEEEEEETADYNEVFDWIGAVCNIDSASLKSFISKFLPSMPVTETKKIACESLRGFFTRQQIRFLIKSLRNTMADSNTLDWISIVVHGFDDCPVGFGLKEHGYFMNGDNSLTLILFNNGYCWKYSTLATHDIV